MKFLRSALAVLAVASATALVPAAAHAQDTPTSCKAKSSFPQMTACTEAYGAAHPSHDAYFYGPTHFRGTTGETFILTGGIAGDAYALQYCRAGKWVDTASARVGSDTKVRLTMTFANMPADANAIRLRNTSYGITSFTMDLATYAYFNRSSASCDASAGSASKTPSKAPSTPTTAKEGNGGLAKTGL